jgi:hypothetical protein
MPFEAYIGYLADKDEAISAGEPIVVEVRDMDTYERKVVRAVIGKPGDLLESADDLWVLDWVEARQEQPWRIHVLEELDEDDEAAVRSDISAEDLRKPAEDSENFASGRGRGNSMPGMMGAEEARKYFENVVGRKTAPRK